MTREEIKKKVVEIIANKIGLSQSEIKESTSFKSDIGTDSLDDIELLMEFEYVFGIKIPDEEMKRVATVGDVINGLAEKLYIPSAGSGAQGTTPPSFVLDVKLAEWSEEDEERLNSIIESYKVLLKDYKACHDVDYIPYNSNTVIRNVVDDVNFLKSLRPQPHWKPSEEQMKSLLSASSGPVKGINDNLRSLYEDLKKL